MSAMAGSWDNVPDERTVTLLTWFLAALLTLCWVLGGVTQDSTSADEILQLLSLPVLLMAAVILARRQSATLFRVSILLPVAILALPTLQLLPMPASIANLGAARQAIHADLATAAVNGVASHVGVSRFASERALWSLLPALAMYLGVLALPQEKLRLMLALVLALALASALFAFFQLSLPDGSSLLLYTQWGRNFGGAFANPNHQGSALSMAAVIAIAYFLEGRRRRHEGDRGHRYWLYGFLCLACIAMVPLANGSAAMLLIMVGLVVVVAMLGALDWSVIRRHASGRLALAATLGGLLVVGASATALHKTESGRQLMAVTSAHIGQQFAPWGAGTGSFVPIYAQYQTLAVARSEVINHAHNEYVQWWLEAGVPALLVLAGGLMLFAWAGWQVLARMPSRRLRTLAAPAWTCLLLLLMHSLVDFPLRTSALMATAGLLAGVLLATINASRTIRRSARKRSLQPA